MTQVITAADTERFRVVIARQLGLHFDDAKLGVLADLLRRRTAHAGRDAEAYLSTLETAGADDEVGALSQELTVPETYFFRNNDQFRAFAEMALPDRMRAQLGARRLRVLSAGCASGEEAYSLAILARDVLDPSWDLSILAIDVNPAMVRKAVEARYSAWALRETPGEARARWFKPHGRDFVLDDAVRSAVRFEARNLVHDDPRLWPPDSYDVVFFRNVLMYFTHEQAQAVIGRIGRALRPGGYLFLGHAETLRGLSGAFRLKHTHGTFYYQRKDQIEAAPIRTDSAAASLGLTPGLTPGIAPGIAPGIDRRALAVLDGTETWIEAIGKATARIETLTDPMRSPASIAPRAAAASAVRPVWDLGLALDLLREERFSEASELVRRLPAESTGDPDVLLLNAVLLTHRGHLAEAEEACTRLLAVDDLSAGAHYLLALCREAAGDRPSAVYHDQVAVYLDATFAMPRVHLGLVARRAGDRATARRELESALPLLQSEDASRLLLFGGGFSREALMALCRTELVGCGGTS